GRKAGDRFTRLSRLRQRRLAGPRGDRGDAAGAMATCQERGMIDDYADYDALGLADLVRRRELSAEELLETVLERVAAVNPRLNAIVTPLYDQARAAVKAGLPEGPFTGVPYAFKELVVSVAGAPTTSASRLYARNMPAADSEIVSRCRKAGLAVIGKT